MFEQYEHRGKKVWVRGDLKGKHRDFCLCFKCKKFKPGQETNCGIAKQLYDVCRWNNLTTPVWECNKFEEGSPDFSSKDE